MGKFTGPDPRVWTIDTDPHRDMPPEGVDPEQPCVRVHSALPNGTVSTHYVLITFAEDGAVELPFVNLDGTLFLRALGGELVAMQFVHRIEGLPEPKGS